MTANAFEEDRIQVLAAGCDDFVRKPYRAEEIFAALAQHLGARFTYEEETVAPRAVLRRANLAVLPAARWWRNTASSRL